MCVGIECMRDPRRLNLGADAASPTSRVGWENRRAGDRDVGRVYEVVQWRAVRLSCVAVARQWAVGGWVV